MSTIDGKIDGELDRCGGLDGLVDRMNAVKAVSERYQTFSGLSPDMDGQVKFIWRTDAVEIEP